MNAERISKNYCFTTESFKSPRIDALKKEVKIFNMKRKVEEMIHPDMSKVRYQVRVRPRLGKDNPNAHLYRRGGAHYTRVSQCIRPEHGTRFDVYVLPVRS